MTAYFTHDDVSESIYLNDDASCSINSLIEISGLSQQQLDALIDVGIVVPMNDLALPYFHLHYIVTTQIARRLIDDFELDLNGMLLAMTLIQKITLLEQKLTGSKTNMHLNP